VRDATAGEVGGRAAEEGPCRWCEGTTRERSGAQQRRSTHSGAAAALGTEKVTAAALGTEGVPAAALGAERGGAAAPYARQERRR
jgi:hypothetical protein